MLRILIFKLEAAISSDNITEMEAAIASVPPHDQGEEVFVITLNPDDV